ncbi:hypothetical protein [Adhaeribacter rhizoryzae]|uniref:Uncharacterized protein n=1 Tax=Adhaeribacter rhizoryzae TaxID=2607907 RepID=A0A5M6DDK2_9BACT|nr:hypothetical protein [Adhaeribacter rhizoryzae]KAA5544169.1 hypothetical protein F0145_14760 [Adhaeribacter rhizoryzae]
MDKLDKSFTNAILKALEKKLERSLSEKEIKVFSLPRSLMAYEMIIDYIKADTKSKKDIEHYVENVVNEYDSLNKAKKG